MAKNGILFNEDVQQIWNKLTQITDLLNKMFVRIKHLERDNQDLSDKIDELNKNE